MKLLKKTIAIIFVALFCMLFLRAALTKQELAKKLWPRSRLKKALAQVEKLKSHGLMSNGHYQRKKKMLNDRLSGTFKPTMLSTTNPPLNFIQNGGFENINRNSGSNRSRWLWWGGWSWGGNYENKWEDRPGYVRSGKYSARIRCTGKKGRIGISTPKLPVVPGAREYIFSIWAKGIGANQLFLNFEAGARGTLRKQIGSKWEKVILKGTLEQGAQGYSVYIYVTGGGTIWLDDAKLVPTGMPPE